MSARVQIAGIAERWGWTVEASSYHVRFTKDDQSVYVCYSVRGDVTEVRINHGPPMRGANKRERVCSWLMERGTAFRA